MTDKRAKIIQWIALLGCGFIATQIATILFKGEAFCLNQGCKIIEDLTTIPPIYFNLAGFLFFLAVFAASRCTKNRPTQNIDWLRLLLLTGLVIEGVLISYQLFVAQTLCSYCLIIFSLIILLNISYGRQQLLLGVPILLAVLIAFSSLNFGSAQILLQAQNLESGTFAIKGQEAPASQQLYLFFSSDCSHCRNVLAAIEGDNNCELNFNPIDRIESLDVAGLEYFPDYNPSLNRLLLSLLEIKTIPVLLAKNPEGLTLIKGEGAIVDFINATCFDKEIDLYSGSSSDTDDIGFSTEATQEGECEIEVECPDPVEESTSSAY
jgi:uncharacterized membrane protein